MSGDVPVSILLDLKEQVGALNANMMEARNSRERMEKSLDEVKATVAEIKPVVAVVAKMKPEHDDLIKFKDRMGAYMWLGGAVASAVLLLLWHGLGYFSGNIKTALGRLFH